MSWICCCFYSEIGHEDILNDDFQWLFLSCDICDLQRLQLQFHIQAKHLFKKGHLSVTVWVWWKCGRVFSANSDIVLFVNLTAYPIRYFGRQMLLDTHFSIANLECILLCAWFQNKFHSKIYKNMLLSCSAVHILSMNTNLWRCHHV